MSRFTINASSLRLRQAPSLTAAILGSFTRGTIVTGNELSADGDWRRVNVDNKDGWMADGFLAPAEAVLSTTADAPWMRFAEDELAAGVAEIPGNEDNPRIIEYHAATSLRATDDETPWCSAFVNWCMKKAEVTRTDSAAARSWLAWGQEVVVPRLGCVTILRRTDNPAQGHVGFFVGMDGADKVRLLGGNQGNAVTIRRFPVSRVLGHRWRA